MPSGSENCGGKEKGGEEKGGNEKGGEEKGDGSYDLLDKVQVNTQILDSEKMDGLLWYSRRGWKEEPDQPGRAPKCGKCCFQTHPPL